MTNVTLFTPSATIQRIHKEIYAERRENEAVLITIYFSWETIPIEDKTTLITKDAGLVGEIDFPLKQTKVSTSLKIIDALPSQPFKFVEEQQ